jgi:diguanylate cyclase (GGDEF)-like protein
MHSDATPWIATAFKHSGVPESRARGRSHEEPVSSLRSVEVLRSAHSAARSVQDPAAPNRASVPLGVLVVEDESDVRDLVTRLAQKMGYTVRAAATGREALRHVGEQPPDIVLLDLMMPEMNGLEFCRIVRADPSLQDLHIIITSAKGTTADKVRGLDLGAADYLTKPFSLAELRARLKVAERIVRSHKELRAQQTRLERLAREDPLTGLSNRRHFEERMQEECHRAQRHHHPVAVLLGDIDHFKTINDRYGHAYGDLVLQQVAQTLRHHCRRSDLVARYGGEEFAVLLPETRPEEAEQVAKRLCSAVRALAVPHASGPFHVTISFGIAVIQGRPPHGFAELLAKADVALYTAKHNGRDRVEQYPAGSQQGESLGGEVGLGPQLPAVRRLAAGDLLPRARPGLGGEREGEGRDPGPLAGIVDRAHHGL